MDNQVEAPDATLGFGVTRCTGPYGHSFRVRVQVAKQKLHVGRFATAHEAKLAYDLALSILRPLVPSRPFNFPGIQHTYSNPKVEAKAKHLLLQMTGQYGDESTTALAPSALAPAQSSGGDQSPAAASPAPVPAQQDEATNEQAAAAAASAAAVEHAHTPSTATEPAEDLLTQLLQAAPGDDCSHDELDDFLRELFNGQHHNNGKNCNNNSSSSSAAGSPANTSSNPHPAAVRAGSYPQALAGAGQLPAAGMLIPATDQPGSAGQGGTGAEPPSADDDVAAVADGTSRGSAALCMPGAAVGTSAPFAPPQLVLGDAAHSVSQPLAPAAAAAAGHVSAAPQLLLAMSPVSPPPSPGASPSQGASLGLSGPFSCSDVMLFGHSGACAVMSMHAAIIGRDQQQSMGSAMIQWLQGFRSSACSGTVVERVVLQLMGQVVVLLMAQEGGAGQGAGSDADAGVFTAYALSHVFVLSVCESLAQALLLLRDGVARGVPAHAVATTDVLQGWLLCVQQTACGAPCVVRTLLHIVNHIYNILGPGC